MSASFSGWREPAGTRRPGPSSILLILLFILLRTASQIVLKMIAVDGRHDWHLLAQPVFYIACLLYLAQAAVWLSVLKRYALSFVYPFTGLTVITIMVSGWAFFAESITLGNVLGALTILLGVVFISGGKPASSRHLEDVA